VRDYNREVVILLLDRITEVIVIVVYFPAHSGVFWCCRRPWFFTHIGFSTL